MMFGHVDPLTYYSYDYYFRFTFYFLNSREACDTPQAIENAQLLMQELQRVVFNYEGVINKLLVDDKGLLALAVFGLPPFLHQDDAARAVGAGLEIVDNIPYVF